MNSQADTEKSAEADLPYEAMPQSVLADLPFQPRISIQGKEEVSMTRRTQWGTIHPKEHATMR